MNLEDLFDEVMSIQNCFATIKNSEDFAKFKTITSKWNKIFRPSGYNCMNIFKLVSFVLSILGTSAYTVKEFSVSCRLNGEMTETDALLNY